MLLLLLAGQAVRTAIVTTQEERRPALARAVWPSYPPLLFNQALAGIGAAAREGRAPDPGLLADIERGSLGAPLAVEPLLVKATAQLAAGQSQPAEALLRAAVRQDPRAPAARFLLADLYIRQERLGDAMIQLTALDRRVGGISNGFAPAVARYLGQPGALPKVAPVLASNPPLRRAVLQELSTDAKADPLLLALARRGDLAEVWLAQAFERLLAAGNIPAARALYAKAGGAPTGGLTRWSGSDQGGPLTWRFNPSPSGAIESQAGGPMQIIYYGREEATLAVHLLLLPPGNYVLDQRVTGEVPAGTLEWRLVCVSDSRSLGVVPVASGAGRGALTIPANCPAQRLQLFGRPGEFPKTINAAISSVTLQQAGAAR
ncbi:tetratricopeptide repeat protein [Sphingomonas swuensis]|uniref:tetratricopeptide repeat protein n=1 Tax=Sphingomonas swuensis TaxID=977800 RepID=UPI0031D499AD